MSRCPLGEPVEQGYPEDDWLDGADVGHRLEQRPEVDGSDRAVAEWGAVLGGLSG